MAQPDATYAQILLSRGNNAARSILDEYSGIIVADSYGVYGALERERGRPSAASKSPSSCLRAPPSSSKPLGRHGPVAAREAASGHPHMPETPTPPPRPQNTDSLHP